MQITKIKQWDKSQNGEVVNHVEIHYSEGVKNIILHDTRKASPEFYKLFKELSPHVCNICEFANHEAERTIVTGVSISYDESPEGDEIQRIIFTARRKLVATSKPLIFNTPLMCSTHTDKAQELSAECFGIVEALSAEAAEYIEGKREQLDLFDGNEEENPAIDDQEAQAE